MKIIHFPLALNYVNAFLAIDTLTSEAFLVDCGALEDQITAYVARNKIRLKFLLLTHSHYDHIGGVAEFKKTFGVPIYSATNSHDVQLSEGDKISFGDDQISVLETPGHTPDGISFYVDRAVFVGDAIFSGAVGGTTDRQKFEEETEHVWKKLLALPDDTVIYPGHGAPSLVGIERLFNPFFN